MANINLRNIPDLLKNQFKAFCDLKNSNMTHEIIIFMKKVVERKEGKMGIMDYEGLTLEDLLKKKPDRQLLEKLLNKESDEKKRKKIFDAINKIK